MGEIDARGLDDVGLYRVNGRGTTVNEMRDAFIQDPEKAVVSSNTSFHQSLIVAD